MQYALIFYGLQFEAENKAEAETVAEAEAVAEAGAAAGADLSDRG